MFYPATAQTLRHDVLDLLAQAKPAQWIPKVIIAPHAGYIYSGPIAASAYALLRPIAGRIRRVILLGPAHRVWVNGLALPGHDFFDTPLGRIPIDAEAIHKLAHLPFVERSPSAHAMEHSLEVQLPFLQTVLGDFSLVPLIVGAATPEQVAQVLETLWGDDETLIVVSSDLSHYLPYDTGRATDLATIDAILALDTHLVGEQACGASPVNGLLLTARRKNLQPHLLDLRSSGDTAGDKQRVVGYAAIAFTETAHDK
jgi:hypothetical protein